MVGKQSTFVTDSALLHESWRGKTKAEVSKRTENPLGRGLALGLRETGNVETSEVYKKKPACFAQRGLEREGKSSPSERQASGRGKGENYLMILLALGEHRRNKDTAGRDHKKQKRPLYGSTKSNRKKKRTRLPCNCLPDENGTARKIWISKKDKSYEKAHRITRRLVAFLQVKGAVDHKMNEGRAGSFVTSLELFIFL